MKLFIGILILMGMQQTFAQNVTDPVLFMGNISNPFDIDASGNQITTFSFEIKGFNDVSSGEAGAQVLINAGVSTTAAASPCNNSANMCTQDCVEYTLGIYQCFCFKGYEDKTTQAVPPSPLPQTGFVCEDVDECILYGTPCGKGQFGCNNTIGSYNCSCVSGYVVSADQESCEDYDECTNATLSNCDINASCINFDGGFRCECNQGYVGDGTNGNCTDIDECASGNVTCGEGDCSNTDGSYRCNCYLGYEESNSTGTPFCIDIDECADASVSCAHPDAECQNTRGSFRCRCKRGFSGNGTSCTDIDECLNLNDCHQNATCNNTHGNYTCECHDSFLGDGFTCNAGEMSYCFRARVVGRIDLIRGFFSDAFTQSQTRNSLARLWLQYQRDPDIDNFFVNGYNVTVEPTSRNALIVRICFDAISKTPDELAEIFDDNSPTGTLNGRFWSLRDFNECPSNYLRCDDEATCENTMGDAICTCPDNRYDFGEFQGLTSGKTCMEPIEFECQGSSANISLLTPYWAQKYINVRNVFVNQGCSGTRVGIWHRYICNGTVTANGTHLIAAFKVADVIPPGGYAINRLDETFRCIQPAQQNFTSNITAEDVFVDPGVDTDDNADPSIKPLVFVGGYDVAVVDGVKTGEKACIKLEDPNIPENIKIMVEEMHTSAPGDDQKFTLLRDYCPVSLPGLEIETTNGGICFTMHRPQASTILEVQLVVNLCTTEDCPTPSCGRKRRSTLMRQKRSEELKAISFLIKIDPEDNCDRDCGTGACLLDILNQKQCICPDHSIKSGDGKCKATRNGSFSNDDGSTSNINILILVVGLLAGVFVIACVLGFIAFSRRRSAILVNDKQMEMKGVYTNTIDVD